jgi:hypothetical protein
VTVSGSRGFLLLRRAGGVWGIANAAVEGLAWKDGSYRLEVGGAALAADEILGVVEDLRVLPALVLRRFWTEVPAGLAVHGLLPVVVVDPDRVPAALRPAGGAGGDGLDEAS